MDYSEKVKDIITQTLQIERNVVKDELSINDIPEWDSVGNLNIIQSIEEELEVEIPIENLFELTSVKLLVEEVNKLKNE